MIHFLLSLGFFVVIPTIATAHSSNSGRLQVYVRYGVGLQGLDGGWSYSDPYVEVVAYDHRGNTVRLTTDYKLGDHSPVWHQNLDFGGCRQWTKFVVRVWDSDDNADDPLSAPKTYLLSSHTSRTNEEMSCNTGHIYFDYHFQAT